MSSIVDLADRIKAIDTSRSFIVQAPAGSGKTELLTQRYLALLAEVEEPEAILAITFTRKAAREMRERIIQSLTKFRACAEPEDEPDKTKWQLSQKVLARNEQLGWRLTENPQRLHVQTIDGFNNSLIKRMPSLSGLGAEAQTEENAEDIYNMAADQTLALLHDQEHGPLLEQFMLHLDGNIFRARRLIATMLAKRDQWQEYLTSEDEMDRLRETIEESLHYVVNEEIANINQQLNQAERDKISMLATYAMQHLKVTNVDGHFTHINNDQESISLPELGTDDLTVWRDTAQWLLTKKNELRKTVDVKTGFPPKGNGSNAEEKNYFDAQKKAMLALLADLGDREETIISITKLPDTAFEDDHWQHLTDLIKCLKLALAQLKLLFAARDRLDFQEVAIRALKALDVESTDLAMILDYQIQHILIDEFQDTSQAQFRLLESLVREWYPDDQRTLFLVGDPMQSIYRFREADVGLFLKASQDGIANIQPEPLTLSVNFRSTRPVVDWVNNTFSQIFPKQQDIYRGAVSYSYSDSADTENPGLVKSLLFDSPEAEATALAAEIQQLLAVESEKDIAVLVRGRKQLLPLIAALQKANQTYQATEIEVLGKRPVITDLQTLLKALNDPTDRIAWLGVLRAPWCGLMLDELGVMADSRATVLENMQNSDLLQHLSAASRVRISFVLEKLSPWIETITRRPLTDVLEASWLALDGPAYVISESDLDAADLFFEMLGNITQGGVYVDPEQISIELERLFAPSDPKGNDKVQIMTIHKSKGLQFNTVILPNLNYRGANDDKTLLRWMTIPNGLLMAPLSFSDDDSTQDSIYKYLSDIDKKRGDFERLRVTYVACTRAETRLILSANVTMKDDEPKLQYNSMLKDLWPCISSEVEQLTEMEDGAEEPETEADNRLYRKEIIDVSLAAQLKSAQKAAMPIHQTTFDRYPNASMTRRAVGIVCHRWLEYLADTPLENILSELETYESVIKQQLQQLGVTGSEAEDASTEVLEHLSQTISCEMGNYLLQAHDDAQSELALERYEDNQVRYYVIDRTFIDDQGCRWIVDYKTSSHEGAGRDEFLQEQRKKYNDQLENYASLFAGMEDRPIRLMIYFTRYQKYEQWDWIPTENGA